MDSRFRFENKNEDFPFYNNQPEKVSGRQWLIMLVFPFIGFLFLTKVYIPFFSLYINELLSGIVLLVFSLLGLRLTVGQNWRLMFRKIHQKDVLLVIGYVVGALIVASAIGGIIEFFRGTLTDNPTATTANDPNAWVTYLQLRVQELFQLLGEEFLAILPFLAVLHISTMKFGWERRKGILIGWIISSILFGLLHLPTYDWNLLQCIFVIGGSRMILTLPYIQTKNLWISYFVHYLYDMLIFTVAFLSQ
ncbi:CPBP family intramembrane glutamic endopeptidase [uncultured Enterococcus sp.]|uniref:CPBP family intramembrane glutamic endopeptidase n=1 Tax=uncultured Enterococcus sp. TaxID=167972 RepID=UPI002AA61775|nr:CPBP family intramembrane glutamic endopeptidase [uncultured Enterococcus sp.]